MIKAQKIFSAAAVLIASPPVGAAPAKTLKEQWSDIIFKNDPSDIDLFVTRNPSFDIGTGSISKAQKFLEDAGIAYKKLEKTVDDAIKKTLSTNLEKNNARMVVEFVYGTFPIRLVTSTGALYRAIKAGNWEVFKFLIKKGAAPNPSYYFEPLWRSFSLRNALAPALPEMRSQLVKDLIEAPGMDLNLADSSDLTPLNRAILSQAWSSIGELLNAGADPNRAHRTIGTSLHCFVHSVLGHNRPVSAAHIWKKEPTDAELRAATQLVQEPTLDLTLQDSMGLTALEYAKRVAFRDPADAQRLSVLIPLLEQAEANRNASDPEEKETQEN